MTHRSASPARRRDLLVAAACGAVVAAMVGMAYGAVPFYDWFCRATGFNGTTQVAGAARPAALDRKITVRFDANIASGLPWKFAPDRTSIEARLGEVVTMDYIVVNESAHETVGLATYNVAPLTLGAYFQKINCFCFAEQHLRAGERREMTVVFYVDPALMQDPDGKDVNTITLSYTFYPQRTPQRPVAESAPVKAAGRI